MDALLGIVLTVLMVGAMLWVAILLDDGSPPPPRRPQGMGRQVWNMQQKQWREYKRKYGIDRSGGAGYSGGGDGGDGGGGD